MNEISQQGLGLARRFVERAKTQKAFDDVTAWALTGSVARGEATKGSDLDLWALVPRARMAEHFVFENEAVTVFFESLSLLEDETYLVTVEAEKLITLEDPLGSFKAIRSHAQSLHPRFVAFTKAQTQEELFEAEDFIAAASSVSLDVLAAHYRKTKALLLWGALKKGQRRKIAPKAFNAFYGRALGTMAHQALALELAPTLLKEALQKYWPQIVAEADKSLKDLALALEHTPMWKKIKAREGPDALMAARVFLLQQFDEMPATLFDDLRRAQPQPFEQHQRYLARAMRLCRRTQSHAF